MRSGLTKQFFTVNSGPGRFLLNLLKINSFLKNSIVGPTTEIASEITWQTR